MNLLQVIPALDAGGAERTAVDIARAVVAVGGRSVIASRGGALADDLEREGVHIARMPAHSKNPYVIWRNRFDLADLARSFDCHVIHARSRAPAWSALGAARAAQRAFVTTYHGAYRAESGLKRRYNSVMVRGDRVIANSAFTRDLILATYDVDPDRIRVIPRGIDVQRFDPGAVDGDRMQALASAWGVPAEERRRTIVAPGRLTRWKGQALVVEALARLAERGRDDFHCLIVGGDAGHETYRRELEDAVARFGIGDRVRLTGHCDDMPAALALADLVLAPSSRPEAFGRVAVEAQAMSRPVIAADHGGARETVVDGVTGWLIPPNDAAALAERIETALDLSPEARLSMGDKGLKRARALFSVATMCASTLSLYEELLVSRS